MKINSSINKVDDKNNTNEKPVEENKIFEDRLVIEKFMDIMGLKDALDAYFSEENVKKTDDY